MKIYYSIPADGILSHKNLIKIITLHKKGWNKELKVNLKEFSVILILLNSSIHKYFLLCSTSLIVASSHRTYFILPFLTCFHICCSLCAILLLQTIL